MDSTPTRRRVAVIGGGVAGLAAARAVLSASPGVEIVVLEGSPEVGGKLRLGEVAGIPVDLGAESILNRRPEGVRLAGEVGLAESIVHPTTAAAGVWTYDRIRLLPPSLMGIPADPTLASRLGILSEADARRAESESKLPPLDLNADVGVGVVVADRLGAAVRDRLVEPLLGGVYAGRSDEISLYAALPQLVEAARASGSLLAAARDAVGTADEQGERPPVFAGIAGGVGRLAIELAHDIEARGGEVRRGATAREVRRSASGWDVIVGPTSAPEVVEVDAVIVAVPAAPAARLLHEACPVAARELAAIESASMAVVTFAFDPSSVRAGLDGSGFLVPPVDGRVIKAATYSSHKWSWLGRDVVVMRCSIGRFREESQLQRPDDELVAAALRDLGDAIGLDAGPIDASVTRWGGALPQYAVGHLDRVATIKAAVSALDGLAVCGAAYDGVGIPAVIANGEVAAAQVVARLGRADTMGP